MMDYSEKMQRFHDYVQALEEEKRKIEVFQRELPLCLELVTQAIETCKQQLSGTTEYMQQEQSECSDHTSSDRRPVLEEFIPIKRANTPCSDDEDHDSNTDKKKSDWLRSVQLWNQSPDPPAAQQDVAVVVEVNRNGGAFKPFHKEKSIVDNSNASPASKPPATATSSSAETVTRESGGKKEEKDKDGQRKQRRCWSPELHRRFLQALQQLGGSHAATPKQIRELMKVEGLTNDEVKSHLQKYRLHTRRPSSRIHNNGNQQAPQFLVVGGIWVPPGDYAAVAATTAASGEATSTVPATANGIYAPIAAPPPPTTVPLPSKPRQKQSEERGSHSEGGVHSHSPSMSSSTHTTTASHAL